MKRKIGSFLGLLGVLLIVFHLIGGLRLYEAIRGKRPGDNCVGEDATCVDDQSGLFCRDDTLMAVSCRGPMGCESTRLYGLDHVRCDITGNEDGDACWNPTGVDETASCASDGKTLVRCRSGVIARIPCTEGCRREGADVLCDTSIAEDAPLSDQRKK